MSYNDLRVIYVYYTRHRLDYNIVGPSRLGTLYGHLDYIVVFKQFLKNKY